jgi:hypothetical protein
MACDAMAAIANRYYETHHTVWWHSTDIQVVHMEPRRQAVTAAIGSRFSHFPTPYLIPSGC